jgi:hypothetical protein
MSASVGLWQSNFRIGRRLLLIALKKQPQHRETAEAVKLDSDDGAGTPSIGLSTGFSAVRS